MISHPDHKPISSRELAVKYHWIHLVNGEVDSQYRVTVATDTISELHQTMVELEKQIYNGEVSVEITKVVEDWIDIPSPPQEQLQQAIEITNSTELPQPPVPEVPEKYLRTSWD